MWILTELLRRNQIKVLLNATNVVETSLPNLKKNCRKKTFDELDRYFKHCSGLEEVCNYPTVQKIYKFFSFFYHIANLTRNVFLLLHSFFLTYNALCFSNDSMSRCRHRLPWKGFSAREA
jgi:hypothetical protein